MKGDDAEKWNDIFCPLADWFIKRQGFHVGAKSCEEFDD